MLLHLRRILFATVGIALLATSPARADLPAGYIGKPFDPAMVGGPKCPPDVKAGPYAIPGRLEFENYDMGGDGKTYHTGDHTTGSGTGYRTDAPTATFSLTGYCNNAPCAHVWYDTSAALDGTPYPSATVHDINIGAVQVGDWFDITVNVATAGTYSLSTTFSSGAGPPGGEGGDGTEGLKVFSNGTLLGMWNDIFPNFNTMADFRHWKAHPNFLTVQLPAGLQVIKLQTTAKHMQLDYVQFDLVGADGGVPPDSGTSGGGGSTGAGGSSSVGGATGASGATGGGGGVTGAAGAGMTGGTAGAGTVTGGTSGGEAGSGATGGIPGNAGSPGSGNGGTIGAGGSTSSGSTGGSGAVSNGSNGCACEASGGGGSGVFGGAGVGLLLGCALARRRRSRR
jgi:hypothetical protein